MSESMRRKAYHVAGHATLALVQDFEVEQLSVTDGAPFMPGSSGARCIDSGTALRIPHQWPAQAGERENLAKWLIRIFLAGRCAELLHEGESRWPSRMMDDAVDWAHTWSIAALLYPDEQFRMGYLEEEFGRAGTFLRHRPYYDSVIKISNQLMRHGTLQGQQVREIYERALRRRR